MRNVGICLGASNITVTELLPGNNGQKEIKTYARAHEGDVPSVLADLKKKNKLLDADSIAVTGRKFKDLVDLPTIAEPEAVERAYQFIEDEHPGVDAIVSAGGETFVAYELDSRGLISDVHTGNKCASGTGEFFLQQIKRMDLEVEEAMEIARTDDPYHVSGRCSVFCKSDCTHALNKGEDKGRIVAGLCNMMADEITELLATTSAQRVLVTGGCSLNSALIAILDQRFSDVIVSDFSRNFESTGTALWARDSAVASGRGKGEVIKKDQSSFDYLEPLAEYEDRVEFHSIDRDEVQPGARCLVGVDVGSTTTKAVLIREEDRALLGSVYLRTSGDPVGAARKCYRQLADQVGDREIEIIGLGVTGSGRQIVGLHALTDSIENEIIAHARAAVHFNEKVDTIFEIGGQDAKYTHLTRGVPTDYAMNEACSAGTGSFLEESAWESLNVPMEEIEDYALDGDNPPNFSDQCAAFISSDIKNAIQEGLATEDICAGLVYSICMNYSNRVQGNRPTGEHVFMQGGVCYNRAVPVAMAALTGKNIVVPPEPGLMGAYGVALVVQEQLEMGLIEENRFDLDELAGREINRLDPFTCQGGKEDCDRECEISLMEIEDEKYPFGGICSKYENARLNRDFNVSKLDMVRRREEQAFEEFSGEQPAEPAGEVGLNRSLLTNALFPLFSTFFKELGYEVVIPDKAREEGRRKQGAAFCFPVELSHGYIEDLVGADPDYIFMPHVKGLPVDTGQMPGTLCPLSQGESYYLRASLEELAEDRVLSEIFDFTGGYADDFAPFWQIGRRLNCSRTSSKLAFEKAVEKQKQFEQNLTARGEKILAELEENPDEQAIVLFGRPYNAFSSDANLGIPHKFASRGEKIIPMDMLPLEDQEVEKEMYWSMGQKILKAASFVSDHPQLFGVYITNFSCGPDSFLISYFRQQMGKKPSLTLELDSHTADAGVDTRIEAFLDVVDRYKKLPDEAQTIAASREFQPARIDEDKPGKPEVIDSEGQRLSLEDERVKILVPSMGETASQGIAASMRYAGLNAEACPPPAEEELEQGRANTLCKECLPLQLTVGSLFKYLEDRDEDEVVVYFMPDASGPCRFGQYNVFLRKMIREREIEDVAFFSPTAENSYAGMGMKFTRRAWTSIVAGDLLDEIYSSLLVLAENKERAIKIFNNCRQQVFEAIARAPWKDLKALLEKISTRLSHIPLEGDYSSAPRVALTGEIYVRSDSFSRQFLVEKLAEKGIITRVSPNVEWIYYTDYCVQEELSAGVNWWTKFTNRLAGIFKKKREKDIKDIIGETGLCNAKPVDVENYIEAAEDIVSPELTGEAILTAGGAIEEMVDHVSGVIAVGPFGCMPNRVAEALLRGELDNEVRRQAEAGSLQEAVSEEFPSLPFLAIETDGSAFPQVVEARLEAFCLQVEKLNDFIQEEGRGQLKSSQT
ncbi:MAG: acyl-CoA dehydratase activase [bacterium]